MQAGATNYPKRQFQVLNQTVSDECQGPVVVCSGPSLNQNGFIPGIGLNVAQKVSYARFGWHIVGWQL